MSTAIEALNVSSPGNTSMSIRIYNTLSKTKEDFASMKCGPGLVDGPDLIGSSTNQMDSTVVTHMA